MDYNEKKKLAAKMTLNGVMNEIKGIFLGLDDDDAIFDTDYLTHLFEIYTDAIHDIENYTEQIRQAKAGKKDSGM